MGIKSKELFTVHEVGGSWILTAPDKTVSESFSMAEKSLGDVRLVYNLLKILGIHRRFSVVPFEEEK